MKRIEAFLQTHKLNKVIAALHELPHFPGFTVFDAHGQGQGRGEGGHFVYEPNEGLLYHKRSYLIIVCENGEATAIVNAIAKAAFTGNKGDGMVSVSDLRQVVRIRTGAEGQ